MELELSYTFVNSNGKLIKTGHPVYPFLYISGISNYNSCLMFITHSPLTYD